MGLDLEIIETGNGGDLVLNGNDLAVVTGYENLPYLSCFCGGDWWGNALLLDKEQDQQFNATTERVMQEVTLNSAGRIAIENAILADLAYIKKQVPGTEITVSTSVQKEDRLDMLVNIDGEQFAMEWNPGEVFENYKV